MSTEKGWLISYTSINQLKSIINFFYEQDLYYIKNFEFDVTKLPDKIPNVAFYIEIKQFTYAPNKQSLFNVTAYGYIRHGPKRSRN